MPALPRSGGNPIHGQEVKLQMRMSHILTKFLFQAAVALVGQGSLIVYLIRMPLEVHPALLSNFHGLFLSEPMRKGHVRKFRKGFNTTHKTKITACSSFKNALERNKMKINSKPLISELKTFVAHGVGYGAKTGEHDDLVSACLLIIRMASQLADWDPKIYEKMTERMTEDQYPMPIFISGGF